MPELPEVETVRRGLQPAMEGARVISVQIRRPDLRFPFPADLNDLLQGATITSLSRRAKYLLVELDRGQTLIAHLGMSGSYRVEVEGSSDLPGTFYHQRSSLGTHDHVVLDVEGGAVGPARIVYNDPRRFGFLLSTATSHLHDHKMLRDLGPEPTGNSLTAEHLAQRFVGRAQPLKAALLDQSHIAGLGNIYVCEALNRAKLSPKRQAKTLVTKSGQATVRLQKLTDIVRTVIAEAIEAGGSSLRDHKQTDGSLGYFQHRFGAYDREGQACPNEGCRGTITRIVQSGRSTFYCPSCQR